MFNFLGKRKRVISWHGTEDSPSASPEGRPPGSCSSPPCPFLFPGFCTSSPNKRPAFCAGRSLPLRSKPPLDDFIEERRIDLRLKDPGIQFDLPHLFISNIINRECAHPVSFLTRRCRAVLLQGFRLGRSSNQNQPVTTSGNSAFE